MKEKMDSRGDEKMLFTARQLSSPFCSKGAPKSKEGRRFTFDPFPPPLRGSPPDEKLVEREKGRTSGEK